MFIFSRTFSSIISIISHLSRCYSPSDSSEKSASLCHHHEPWHLVWGFGNLGAHWYLFFWSFVTANLCVKTAVARSFHGLEAIMQFILFYSQSYHFLIYFYTVKVKSLLQSCIWWLLLQIRIVFTLTKRDGWRGSWRKGSCAFQGSCCMDCPLYLHSLLNPASAQLICHQ